MKAAFEIEEQWDQWQKSIGPALIPLAFWLVIEAEMKYCSACGDPHCGGYCWAACASRFNHAPAGGYVTEPCAHIVGEPCRCNLAYPEPS